MSLLDQDPTRKPTLGERLKKPFAYIAIGAAGLALTACGNEASPKEQPTAIASQAGETPETEPTTPSLSEETVEPSAETNQDDAEWDMDLEIDPDLPLEYQEVLATRYDSETSWEDYTKTFAIPNVEDLTEEQLATMITTTWRDYLMTGRPNGLQYVDIVDEADAEVIESILIDRQREVLDVLLSNDALTTGEKELATNLLTKERFAPNIQQAIIEGMSNTVWIEDEPNGGDGIENGYRFMAVTEEVSIHETTNLTDGTATILYTLHSTGNFKDAQAAVAEHEPTLKGMYNDPNLDSKSEQFIAVNLDSDGTWRIADLGVQEDLQLKANV